jgi:hypothetical protein
MTQINSSTPVLGAGLNGDRTPVFFERALNHCYSETEEVLRLISRTPYKFRKALNKRKARLMREAEFIERKLKESK